VIAVELGAATVRLSGVEYRRAGEAATAHYSCDDLLLACAAALRAAGDDRAAKVTALVSAFS
jgi:hypothetical protein